MTAHIPRLLPGAAPVAPTIRAGILEHIPGQTYHGRKGKVANAFRYGVDYLLLDPDADLKTPALFSRNAGNFFAFYDLDHGGPRQKGVSTGRGADWVRDVLADHGLEIASARILLMAQPRVLGHVFNPVSFWFCFDLEGRLRVVIPEVNNTVGDRHSYLVHNDDLAPITREDTLSARKIFYVSPFQPVAGGYRFRFDLTDDRIGIWIDYRHAHDGKSGDERGGLIATLTGPRVPLTNRSILRAALRRPFGSRRVLGLIHWQALKLWIKGAMFRRRSKPPRHEVSR